MRILLLGINYAPERTGIAPYTAGLAQHLSGRHDVTVVTGVPHYPEWHVPEQYRRWRADEASDGVRVVRLRHFVPHSQSVCKRALYELSWAGRAAAVAARIPADVVVAIVPALFGAHAARVVARHHRVPYGLIVQDIMGNSAAQSGVRGGQSVSRLTSACERTALRGAAAVATIHPRLAAELARLSGRPDTPSVIYNWTHVPDRTGSRQDMRRRFGWSRDETIALHSGNMGSKQNLEVVIDAARLAKRNGAAVRFVLAGDGSQRAHLERYAADCANITFMESVDESCYTDFLASADVLVINERRGMREMSLPSKMTSYLKAGRPVVAATDYDSATAEFVRASGAGLLTPAGDAQRLLDVVTALGKDHVRSERLGRLGRQFATEHLSREKALAAYDDWVGELVTHNQLTRRREFARSANH